MVFDFYIIIGDVYYIKKLMKEVYVVYDLVLVYNLFNIGVLNNYVYYLLVECRDFDKVEEMSYKIVKVVLNNVIYLDIYVWIFFEKGNYVEVCIYIDDVIKNIKLEEESSVVFEYCGDIYFMIGDVEGVLKYWKKVLELGIELKIFKQKIEKKKYIVE